MRRERVEVKEYTRITSNQEALDGYQSVSEAFFEDLELFFDEFSVSNAHADASEFLRIGKHRRIGKYISVNNYVGVIQTSKGHQVQILPKIDLGSKSEDADELKYNAVTKKIFRKMLKSVRDIPFKHLDATDLNIDRMPLFEIFIRMYL